MATILDGAPMTMRSGTKRVGDGRAFAQEFGVGDDVEVYGAALVGLDDFADEVAGADGDGALVDDDLVAVQGAGDALGGVLDIGQVGRAVLLGRGADGDEDDLGLLHGGVQVRGELEAAIGDVAPDHLLQARLVDGHDALVQAVDLGRDLVHADHVVAHVRKDDARDQPDIPCSDNANVHGENTTPLANARRGGFFL